MRLPALVVAIGAVLAGAPAAHAGDQEADVGALWSITPGGQREVVALPGGLDAGAHGAWSPDGSRIAFVRYKDESGLPTDYGRLVVKAADKSEAEITVATGVSPLDGRPVWSPDGARIAYADHRGDIRTASPAGGKSTLVTRAAGAVHVRWSPDSSAIVYSDETLVRCAPDKVILPYAVYVVTLDGARTRLTKPTCKKGRSMSDEFPVWAGDGTVAFVRGFEDAAQSLPLNSAVYTTRAGDTRHRLRRIAVPTPLRWEVLGGDLVASPDGRTLAIEFAPFTTALGDLIYASTHELWLLPVDGSKARRLTLRPFEGAGPTFGPGGDVTICGGHGVIRIDAKSGKRSLMSRYRGCVAGDWAPDGSHLLVAADLSS